MKGWESLSGGFVAVSGARTDPLIPGSPACDREGREGESAQQELQSRLRQQAAVLRLSQAALEEAPLQTLMDMAVASIQEVLHVEMAKVLELNLDGDLLLLRAGVGWNKGLIGTCQIGTGVHSQAGYTLSVDRPVIVEDLAAETRFTGPELLIDHGVKSGMSVAIRTSGARYGVLGAHSRAIRRFTSDDTAFLELVANTLGSAITRSRDRADLASLLRSKDELVRYERALAECAHALLRSSDEDALDRALTALLGATEASYAFVESNVEDAQLGLCTRQVAEVGRGAGHDLDDTGYWDLVPWSEMPTSRSLLEQGEPHAFNIAALDGPEKEQYNRSPVALKSELDIPVFVDGTWAGLVGFADRKVERTWTEEELRLLVAAASMVGAYWERQRDHRLLEEMVRSKDEFVASVSHELRTPLTVVVGMANELRDGLDRLTEEEVLEFVGLIAEQGNEVADIVEDLLVVARADIDRVSVVAAAVDLDELVRAVVGSLPGDLCFRTEGTAPLAWADPSRVRQIIRNLCTNVIRYGGSEARINFGTIGENARLEVCDNGSGVDGLDHDRIFEAYHRAHDRRAQPGAIGLGLTVSKRLARLMGGDLTYFRRDDWSVFSLSLPMAAAADGPPDDGRLL